MAPAHGSPYLSPLPPTLSGCADHSAALLEALAVSADVTGFSDTPIPTIPRGIAFGGRADASAMQTRRFDAVVAVIGNSEFHKTELRLLLRYGAAVILHDARLMGFYRAILGEGRARGAAAAELGREISSVDMDGWRGDEAAMPVRFLGEVASSASPLIVHAAETAEFVAKRHGVSPRFIPFPPYRLLDEASLTDEARYAARERLGLAPDTALVASFGMIDLAKEPYRIIEAFGRLAVTRRCRLALIGAGKQDLIAALRDHARACGIEDRALLLDGESVPEALYRDYLAAADVAVQLRRAPPGSISGALMDAVAAGLPSVAGATLAEALEPPAYVETVPDGAAPEVIAAAIEAAIGSGRVRTGEARRAFLASRGMDRYAELLLEAVLA
ncbi:MAG: glycosyltransferase [Acidiphilium sp.]